MARVDTIKFAFRRYQSEVQFLKNEFIAELPGLLITQFPVTGEERSALVNDRTVLRFDFVDDWYSVLAFLDGDNGSTGHYRVAAQTPLQFEAGIWQGDNLILGIEIMQNWAYTITGESAFHSAVDDGWITVNSAMYARDTIRRFRTMLEDGCLPQEVMDAVGA